MENVKTETKSFKGQGDILPVSSECSSAGKEALSTLGTLRTKCKDPQKDYQEIL